MDILYITILGSLLLIEVFGLVRKYRKLGFSCFFAFEAIYITNYLVFPIIALTKWNAISTLPQSKAVLMMSDLSVFLNAIILYLNLLIIRYFYKYFASKYKKNVLDGKIIYSDWAEKVGIAFIIANILLVLGILSIVLLISGSGGILRFLSLGQSSRGLVVNISEQIGSELTPFILLSQVLLVTPYIYYFLYNKGYVKARFLFFVSILFTSVYLLFNQGKGPLLLALIPFLLVKDKKKSLIRIGLIVITAFTVSPLLDALFRYITYGSWIYEFDIYDFSRIFWGYYSLSFANFSYRHEIIQYMGLRWCVDYVNWLYLLIPNSILQLFGFSKVGFISLVQYNTSALCNISGIDFNGGLPMDFNLFNYVQLGPITFIAAEIVLIRFLSSIDVRMRYEERYDIMKIIHYRLAIGIIMIFSSFSIESLFRSRLDIVILLFAYLCFFTRNKGRRIKIRLRK